METMPAEDVAAEPDSTNPFAGPTALANSRYAGPRGGKLVHLLEPDTPVSPLEDLVHESFRALVLNPRFVCVGAKAAVQQSQYRIGVYGEMASPDTTAGLAYDLYTFVQEQPSISDDFSSFIACFTGPHPVSEFHFEDLVWSQLQALHDMDYPLHRWDPEVSSEPDDPMFSFSFAGRAFFVVGLHAASSRWTRKFVWPTLVFNAHQQFERLRAEGQFGRWQSLIRSRDTVLQGGTNPNLSNYGERSEARQYSGRRVEEDWTCPFHPHTDDE